MAKASTNNLSTSNGNGKSLGSIIQGIRNNAKNFGSIQFRFSIYFFISTNMSPLWF
ncbi:MAG: hypothetical protein H6565_12170 [Lewinellaceae bacterium]|nr:hypothetical protein [Lewinellaceae bacterium]